MTSQVSLGNIPTATPATSANAPSSELGKDAFLELLITQVQNQNPLDPSDPSQFLAQLASFSSLEQMGQINDGIESLAVLQATGLSLQNVNLVGKTVVHEGMSNAVDDAGEARFRFDVPVSAQKVVVTYTDDGVQKTKEIEDFDVGPNELTLTELTGETVRIDNVKAYTGDEQVDTTISVFAVSKVEGVVFEGGTPMLKVGGLVRIDPAEVLEILD